MIIGIVFHEENGVFHPDVVFDRVGGARVDIYHIRREGNEYHYELIDKANMKNVSLRIKVKDKPYWMRKGFDFILPEDARELSMLEFSRNFLRHPFRYAKKNKDDFNK
jgi:hypothetical protein